MNYSILMVDSKGVMQQQLFEALNGTPHELFVAESIAHANRLLERREIDLVIAAHSLPDGSGENFLHSLLHNGTRTPGLLFVDTEEEELVYSHFPMISQAWEANQIQLLIRYLLKAGRLDRENARLRSEMRVQDAHVNCLRDILSYLKTSQAG